MSSVRSRSHAEPGTQSPSEVIRLTRKQVGNQDNKNPHRMFCEGKTKRWSRWHARQAGAGGADSGLACLTALRRAAQIKPSDSS